MELPIGKHKKQTEETKMVRNCAGTHESAHLWLNVEFCGLFCGMMTWALVLFGSYATTFHVIVPWMGLGIMGWLNILLFNAACALSAYSHMRAMMTDPGSVPNLAAPLPDDDEEHDFEMSPRNGPNKYRKYCKRCKAFKPIRAHHCSICNRCIIKMDHHCPWVNNCVGIGNHKFFLLFLFWTSMICFYALVLVVGKYIACVTAGVGCTSGLDLVVIGLIVEAILFGLFTLCMMGDQSSVVTTNQTQIDRLKNLKHEHSVSINEVFGSKNDVYFHWSWLLPVAVKFPEDLRDRIFGYRLHRDEEMTPLTSSCVEEHLLCGSASNGSNTNSNNINSNNSSPIDSNGSNTGSEYSSDAARSKNVIKDVGLSSNGSNNNNNNGNGHSKASGLEIGSLARDLLKTATSGVHSSRSRLDGEYHKFEDNDAARSQGQEKISSSGATAGVASSLSVGALTEGVRKRVCPP